MIGPKSRSAPRPPPRPRRSFDDAKSMVMAQLKDLPATAMEEWDEAKEVLAAQFKADLAIVQTRVEERHSDVGGWFVGIWDVVTGLPGWARRPTARPRTHSRKV